MGENMGIDLREPDSPAEPTVPCLIVVVAVGGTVVDGSIDGGVRS